MQLIQVFIQHNGQRLCIRRYVMSRYRPDSAQWSETLSWASHHDLWLVFISTQHNGQGLCIRRYLITRFRLDQAQRSETLYQALSYPSFSSWLSTTVRDSVSGVTSWLVIVVTQHNGQSFCLERHVITRFRLDSAQWSETLYRAIRHDSFLFWSSTTVRDSVSGVMSQLVNVMFNVGSPLSGVTGALLLFETFEYELQTEPMFL